MKIIYLSLLFLVTVLSSCKKESNSVTDNVTPPIVNPLPSDPYLRWKSYNYHNYTIEQRFVFFGPAGAYVMKLKVVNDTINDVSIASKDNTIDKSEWDTYKTVDSLFSQIEKIKKDTLKTISVYYDSLYGFPSYIYIDPIKGIADDEYGWRTQNIIKLN